MFVKLAIFACLVASSLAAWNGPLAGGSPAARFPAGIDPKACPNYPDCENPLVALTVAPAAPAPQQPQAAWNAPAHNAQPAWNAPQAQAPSHNWNGAPAATTWNAAPAAPSWNAAPGAPASWNPAPASSWNQQQPAANSWSTAPKGNSWSGAQQWNNNGYEGHHAANAYAAAPAAPGGAPQYPAGVDPSSCPNYPYCS